MGHLSFADAEPDGACAQLHISWAAELIEQVIIALRSRRNGLPIGSSSLP
jgi:hypothetical protein